MCIILVETTIDMTDLNKSIHYFRGVSIICMYRVIYIYIYIYTYIYNKNSYLIVLNSLFTSIEIILLSNTF